MANRLFKKTGVYFVGNFSSKVISAIIVPIYAVYVSSADLGEYDYLLTLTQIIAPVAYLAIWEAILKFCINGKAGDAERAIVTVLRFCVPLVLGTTALVVCASLALSYPPENALALGAMVAAYALARIWQYAARGLSRSKTTPGRASYQASGSSQASSFSSARPRPDLPGCPRRTYSASSPSSYSSSSGAPFFPGL